MKERKLNIIILLMTVAILSLIYIQYYWISVAFKIEEEKFDRNVNEALLAVAEKVEENESAAFLLNTIKSNDDFIFIDKNTIKSADKQKAHELREIKIDRGINIELKVKEHLTNDTLNRKVSFSQNFVAGANSGKSRKFFQWQTDSFLVKKRNLFDHVIQNIIIYSDSVKTIERLKNTNIDSLLNLELGEKGIDAKYYMVIETEGCDSILNIHKIENKEFKATSEYKTRLFPNDFSEQKDFIRLYFPEKQSYIISNMFVMLLFSGLIIFIIIAIFYKSLKMFINQKKITEMKNDLINNITHEFKTPISTISLACEALNEPVLLDEPESFKRYTGMIEQENMRLSTLVENLLNTALLEKGKYKLNMEEVDIHEIIRVIVEKYKSTIFDGEINYKLNADNYIVYGDEFHLTNIFNNLIDNAVKYSENKIVISIETENTNNGILVSISDKGKGISKQDLNKIFDTFYRIPTGNLHNVKGYGIGLSYVKKMVEAHKGNIEAQSKLNEGSTFKVFLHNGKD